MPITGSNPFVAPGGGSKPPTGNWLAARGGLVLFLLTLGLGWAAVAWHANSRAKAARQSERIRAQARVASVRGQLRHAVSALEVLCALVRQNAGALPNFQKAGADLRAAWPDLVTLEIQPNGVVSDIVPRAGYERAIGSNVLKDPAQFASAQAAIQKRMATVAGPLKLYRGEPGIVIRAPIFERGRDGREMFWGFVAASIRLTPTLARARIDELQQAVRDEFGAQDPGSSLAPAPPSGWLDTAKEALEFLGVLLVASLLWLLAHLLRSGSGLEAALADADERLTGLVEERTQAQEEGRRVKEAASAAQAQLAQTRVALRQAESKSSESQARLEAGRRADQATIQALEARLKQADLDARELRGRLDASVHAADTAARAAQAELEETRAALRQAQEAILQLQSRPDAPGQAEENPATQAPLRQGQAASTDSQSWVDAVLDTPEQPTQSPTPASGPPESEAAAPPAAPGPQENPPPPQPAPLDPPQFQAQPPEPPPHTAAPEPEPEPEPPTDKPKAGPEARRKKVRREPELDLFSPAVNPAQLRKAVNQIVPLLAGQDPGAMDCLEDNRAIFQSAFAPEAYTEFEQCIKKRDFDSAQEQLKRAVKRHGIG